MNKSVSLEDLLYEAVVSGDANAVSQLLEQGANPNRNTSHGKTCLGEAANTGNIAILKLLIDVINNTNYMKVLPNISSARKRHLRSHKRKLRHDCKQGETIVKCKSFSDRVAKSSVEPSESVLQQEAVTTKEKNQGYFVFIHSDGSSSDESRVASSKSPLSPLALTPSPQGDLEWDEEIGNVAPTTSEDETWSSMYEWYAAILESTGAALACATMVSSGIDQKDAFLRTALHYASEQGHIGAVKFLFDSGCKADVAAGDGLTPLHVAVIRNHGDIVQMLLAAGSNINYKTHEKMTPLHFAASRGFLDLVKLLISKGAYLEARDTNERTALYLAAGRGHYDVVKCLIAAGANVNGEEIHGYTPLCEAVWQRYPTIVEVLLKANARITHCHKLLHNAIVQRQEEIVTMLASHGAGINLHNDSGDSPLLLAARVSQPKLARILLEKGANVNSFNSIAGATALHIAVENVEDPEALEELLICLLEYKIDMNTTALTGDTALYRALLLHKDHASVLLIRYGADVNASDLHTCGLDNLAIASRRRSPTLASMLIKAGHYVTTPDPHSVVPRPGTTAHWLHHASRQPLQLSDLCRIKIRSTCGRKILFQYIASLPLPKTLIRFLMMEDEG